MVSAQARGGGDRLFFWKYCGPGSVPSLSLVKTPQGWRIKGHVRGGWGKRYLGIFFIVGSFGLNPRKPLYHAEQNKNLSFAFFHGMPDPSDSENQSATILC